jgi:hypothetical protein
MILAKAVSYRIVHRALRRGLRLMLGFEAPRLHAVAAKRHIAPPAHVILACIKKQPSALRIGARANLLHGIRSQQFARRLRKKPHRKLRIGLAALPAQLKSRPAPSKSPRGLRRLDVVIEFFYCARRRSPIIHHGVDGLRSCLAKILYGLQSTRGSLMGCSTQPLRLPRRKNSGLLTESQNIAVDAKQLFRTALAETPVKRIDEVQDGMTGHELKQLRHFLPY